MVRLRMDAWPDAGAIFAPPDQASECRATLCLAFARCKVQRAQHSMAAAQYGGPIALLGTRSRAMCLGMWQRLPQGTDAGQPWPDRSAWWPRDWNAGRLSHGTWTA